MKAMWCMTVVETNVNGGCKRLGEVTLIEPLLEQAVVSRLPNPPNCDRAA